MVYVEHQAQPVTGPAAPPDFKPAKRRGRGTEAEPPAPKLRRRRGRGRGLKITRWFMAGLLFGAVSFLGAAAVAWQQVNALFY